MAKKSKKDDEKSAKGKAAPETQKSKKKDAPKTPGEKALLKKALRATTETLTTAEVDLEALQRELAAERAVHEEAADEAAAEIKSLKKALKKAEKALAKRAVAQEAVVDQAVAETVDEIVAEALADAPIGATDAELAVAVDLALTEAAIEADAVAVELATESDAAVGAADLTPPLPAPEDGLAPDATWTVVRLRAEAKRRGLTGLANATKAQLIARLS